MTDPGVLGTFSRKNAWYVRMGCRRHRGPQMMPLTRLYMINGVSRQWLHYIVVNEEATKEGKIVMDYSGPNPPQGNHRCVRLLRSTG